MVKEKSIKNILFVQDSSPCIRTIKLAAALQSKGLNIYLAHRDKTPDEVYGLGNSAFRSLTRLPKYKFKDIRIIRRLIDERNIDLVHFSNEPDELGARLIKANLKIPVIYDQHDFLSFKKKLSAKKRKQEQICNEEADGTVYITESYKKEVGKYYALIKNSICFANYFSADNVLKADEFLPKLSAKDGKKHLVYLGRITEYNNDHRNIVGVLRRIADEKIMIHIYPSKNKKYMQYNRIPNVVVHENLPYRRLIQQISQYDFGLTVFNDEVASKLPHIRYAMGNKSYDYLCAGLPILAQESLDEVREFTLKNHFGFVLEERQNYIDISPEEYSGLVEHIIRKRMQFSMESQIERLIGFYTGTKKEFDSRI